jgi:hypothetical protein
MNWDEWLDRMLAGINQSYPQNSDKWNILMREVMNLACIGMENEQNE